MSEFTCMIFPDAAVRNQAFLNAACIYFDKVYSLPPSDSAIQAMSAFSRVPMQGMDIDFERVDREYKNILNINDKIDRIAAAGAIEIIPEESALSKDEFKALEPHIFQTLERSRDISTLDAAASGMDNWSDDQPNIYEGKGEFSPLVYRPAYSFKAIQRLFQAYKAECSMACGNLDQYKAAKWLESEIFNGLVGENIHSPVLELVQLTVPNLVAQDLNTAMEIKEKLRSSLEPFRAKMTELGQQVSGYENYHEFYREIAEIVEGNIYPEIEEIKKQIRIDWGQIAKLILPEAKDFVDTGTVLIGSLIADSTLIPAVLALKYTLTKALAVDRHLQEIKRIKTDNPFIFAIQAEELAT